MIPHVNLIQGAAWVAVLLIAWSMYRAQRDKEFASFNLFDIIMDSGRLSRLAVVFMGTWFVTSAIMVQLVLDNKMTEGYFTAYAAAWIAPIISKLFAPAPAPSTTTTTSMSSTEIK